MLRLTVEQKHTFVEYLKEGVTKSAASALIRVNPKEMAKYIAQVANPASEDYDFYLDCEQAERLHEYQLIRTVNGEATTSGRVAAQWMLDSRYGWAPDRLEKSVQKIVLILSQELEKPLFDKIYRRFKEELGSF